MHPAALSAGVYLSAHTLPFSSGPLDVTILSIPKADLLLTTSAGFLTVSRRRRP